MLIQTVVGLVCDVMSVMQLSIMEHNGINLKKNDLCLQSLKKSISGVSFEHNFLTLMCL